MNKPFKKKALGGAFYALNAFLSPAARGQLFTIYRFVEGRRYRMYRSGLWASGRTFQGARFAFAGVTAQAEGHTANRQHRGD